MNEQDYIKSRLKNQQEWYSNASKKNKLWFYWLKSIELIGAISIPFLVNYCENLTIGLIGVIVAIVAGLIGLFKFQEKWTKYRTTAETLKHQLYLYETKTGIYKDESARFEILVMNVESIISKENSEWQNYINQDTTQKKIKNDKE